MSSILCELICGQAGHLLEEPLNIFQTRLPNPSRLQAVVITRIEYLPQTYSYATSDRLQEPEPYVGRSEVLVSGHVVDPLAESGSSMRRSLGRGEEEGGTWRNLVGSGAESIWMYPYFGGHEWR